MFFDFFFYRLADGINLQATRAIKAKVHRVISFMLEFLNSEDKRKIYSYSSFEENDAKSELNRIALCAEKMELRAASLKQGVD